ncbi:MAG: short-chain dehydrogenase [Proteobacteria bacterium]|nr:MAG: short-chain dehydrogenase [Pseudomonadota bacterium]
MILDRFRVTDRVAVVTGAGRGIGRASALALAEAGADVAVAARRRDDLEAVVAEIERRGRRGLAVPCDVNAGEQLDALVEQTLAAFGRIDVVVNNAGGTPPTPMLQLTDEAFEAAFHFNVTSALRLSRKAIPSMLAGDGGAIVNVSSALAHMVESGFVAYGTAKAALSHLTRLMAAEFAPRVRVNALAVGATVTDALSPFLAAGDLQKQMEALTPMARLGTPEDIACAVLYLASPAAGWVTGKVFEIDGGTVDSNWPIRIPGD